jgi:hypothetical protein
MPPTRSTQRRLAGIASLKSLVSAGSVAALLAGCGVISTFNSQSDAAGADQPAPTTQPEQSTPSEPGPSIPENSGGRRLRPGQGQFGNPPSAFDPGSGLDPSSGSQFPMPRTRSSQ